MLLQVKGVMSDNINKVVERGAKLEDLEERAGQNLTHKPRGFYISLPVACERNRFV